MGDSALIHIWKAMGNGFAISALAGKRELMRLGGIDHDQPRVFFSPHAWRRKSRVAAALETIHVYRERDVVGFLWKQGERLKEQIIALSFENHLTGFFELLGRPCNLVFATYDQNRQASQAFRTLFMQELSNEAWSLHLSW